MTLRVQLAVIALVLAAAGLAGTICSYLLLYGTSRGRRLSTVSMLTGAAGALLATGVIISSWVTS